MRRTLFLAAVITAVCIQPLTARDDTEQQIRTALVGRSAVVKMDLPAIEDGVYMTFDDTTISFDKAAYDKLLKEYGVAVAKGSRSKVTGVRISSKGIEIDLDGGGSPAREWVVGGLTLTEPAPVSKSDREADLERQLQNEVNPGTLAYLRTEIEYERNRRIAQDDRNRQAFDRATRLRTEYIEANRKNWGSKVIIFVRSRKPTVTMREMMRSLANYIEFLPRESSGG